MSSIGVPVESSSVASMARIVLQPRRPRSRGSSVGPSTPWFHDRLLSDAVAVVLAVGLVVLAVVGDQVAQREAVVRGDEVERRRGRAAVEDVLRAGEPPAHVGGRLAAVRGAAPERADVVAVGVVPLGPRRPERAEPVAAGADVPRLGDELHLAQQRVLVHRGEERRALVEVHPLARERRREVEAEAVDAHLADPVAQRVEDQPQDVEVADVEGVAAARGVDVRAAVRCELVVVALAEAAEHQRRPVVPALAGVVVDDVEDHLDAGARAARLHHRLELVDLSPGAAVGGVAGVRREEPEGAVAPVVAGAARRERRLGDRVVHGLQLDGGDAEPQQVLDRGRVGEAGVGAAQVLGTPGCVAVKPLTCIS